MQFAKGTQASAVAFLLLWFQLVDVQGHGFAEEVDDGPDFIYPV